MTPQQLLVETQKAAGDQNLSSWFETLKEEGKQLKSVLQVCPAPTTLKHPTNTLNGQRLKTEEEAEQQMIARNKNIEGDVQRFQERKKIEQEVGFVSCTVRTDPH